MNFRAKLDPTKAVAKFTSLSKNWTNINTRVAQLAAIDTMSEAKLMIADNKDGKKQTRYLPKRTVFVSNEMEPPNSDTGRLLNSIKFEKSGNSYLVGTNLKYGKYLEFGTQEMAPRPWLSKAFAIVVERVPEYYDKAMKMFKGQS